MFTKGCMVAAFLGMAMALPMPDDRPQYPDERPQYEERPQYSEEPQYGPPPPGYAPVEEYVEPAKPYAFDYGVKDDYSGAQFGHNENSDGDSVKGSYIVALPDGRIQKVEYSAHPEHGYKATVTYEGEATYPEAKPYEPEQYQPQQYQPQQYAQPPPQEYAQAESKSSFAEPQYAPDTLVYQPEQREGEIEIPVEE